MKKCFEVYKKEFFKIETKLFKCYQTFFNFPSLPLQKPHGHCHNLSMSAVGCVSAFNTLYSQICFFMCSWCWDCLFMQPKSPLYLLCSSYWLWTCSPHVPEFQVVGLQACVSMQEPRTFQVVIFCDSLLFISIISPRFASWYQVSRAST